MSLDSIQFLRDDFCHKFKLLESSRSSIDAHLRRLFGDYKSLLEHLDISCLQGIDRELLYVLNCAVDDCLVESTEGLHSMAKRSFESCSRQRKSSETRIKLEKNFNTLKSSISSGCGSSVSAPHKPASIPLLNYEVHGFQDQFDEIVNKISTSSDQGKMLAVGIVGIGGSGKTTLASMVFNSREVRDKYQIMIWASLTSTLNKKESNRCSVFREILSGVQNNDSLKTMVQNIKCHQGGSKRADHVLDKYVEHFKETLKRNEGKYLIVLDDVWETDYWFAENEAPKDGEPKCVLSREWIRETGGTIVVTSRLEEMAENIVGKRDLYMMSSVSNEACFEIFLDRATKDGYLKREDEKLREWKKDIENNCFGLPMAACTVADIVVSVRREKEEAARKKTSEEEVGAAKDKREGESEAEAAEDKAEVKEEEGAVKDKAETEGEADTSKPKPEAETKADTPEPESETKEDTEAAAGEPKAEAAAPEPKAEADVSKAEEQRESEAGTKTEAKAEVVSAELKDEVDKMEDK